MIHILLAAFNEEAALGAVLENIARALADGEFRIWVVDDGSSDRTAAVARDGAAHLPLVLLSHARNQGLGAALRTGLSEIAPRLGDDDVLVTLDADNTQPPALIPRLVQPIEDGRADVVIASRYRSGAEVVGVPFFRVCTSVGARFLFQALFRVPGVRDYTCGFRAYRGSLIRRALERWGALVTENGFAAAAEWLLKVSALRPRFAEIPLVLRYDRKPTPSKMPVFRTIHRTVGLLIRLRRLRS
jgi:dolichol-phosphate mannosyltransferase